MALVSNQVLDQIEARPTRGQHEDPPALRRAARLLPPDRVLVEMVLLHRLSYRQVATILSQTPGTISRRLRRISARLTDPMVDALLDNHIHLAAEYRRIGIAHFLQGQSLAAIAQTHDLPTSQVKQIITFLRIWHRGMLAR